MSSHSFYGYRFQFIDYIKFFQRVAGWAGSDWDDHRWSSLVSVIQILQKLTIALCFRYCSIIWNVENILLNDLLITLPFFSRITNLCSSITTLPFPPSHHQLLTLSSIFPPNSAVWIPPFFPWNLTYTCLPSAGLFHYDVVGLREFNVHPSNKFWPSQLINYSIRELLFGLSKTKGRGWWLKRERDWHHALFSQINKDKK